MALPFSVIISMSYARALFSSIVVSSNGGSRKLCHLSGFRHFAIELVNNNNKLHLDTYSKEDTLLWVRLYTVCIFIFLMSLLFRRLEIITLSLTIAVPALFVMVHLNYWGERADTMMVFEAHIYPF